MIRQFTGENKAEIAKWIGERKAGDDALITQQVKGIIEAVIAEGDTALIKYTQAFDHVSLNSLKVSEEELKQAIAKVDREFIQYMEEAKENIIFYHEAQKKQGFELIKDDGVYLGQRIIPLQRVGVYVPGGRAAYPSSVLMNVLPARIAGVEEIIMVTPPTAEGGIDPYIAAAAEIAGVDQIYKVGGAQAVAALAYGTKSIPRVDKIIGPGNIYVATAKKLVYGQVDIDMIAGPSEILVIADEQADPRYVAADLLSQAEHDPMASAILLTTSTELAGAVTEQLKLQTERLSKQEIIKESLANYGAIMVLDTLAECIELSNQLAPEHLELMVAEPKQ